MFNKLAYSAVALTVSLGIVMSCQAEATGKDYASAFNQVKQINAGDLNVGYVDIGPKEGQPVILLHGWPYDIHSYADVAPALAAKGYRVIVPSLRGYGTTRFISDKTPRNGQPAAMAKDIVNLMDALNIKQAVFAGYDWGGAYGGYRCGALAGTGEIAGLGKWLPDQQPGDWQTAFTAEGRGSVVVSVLFRHATRCGRLC